jgi:hypothetical protein
MKRKKIALVGIIIFIVIALGVGGYFLYQRFWGAKPTQGTSQNLASTDPNGDPDHDNLSNEKEKYYGTDPLNPDTDGDGYSDGEEINSGFNPLGAGKLNVKNLPVGQYTGVSLEQVFSGKGAYLCSMSLNQQNTPMKVILKVKSGKIRQELSPNFKDTSNGALDSVILIKNGNDVFFGNGVDQNGWLRLVYNATTKSWASPGVTITGGLFLSPQDVTTAHPDKVECSGVEIEDSEFTVLPKYVIEPGMTYEQFQKKLSGGK